MKSPRVKKYIFRIFNYKIEYKTVQFKKSINKGLGIGQKEQPFRQERNPFWEKTPFGEKTPFREKNALSEKERKKVKAHSDCWRHSSSSFF